MGNYVSKDTSDRSLSTDSIVVESSNTNLNENQQAKLNREYEENIGESRKLDEAALRDEKLEETSKTDKNVLSSVNDKDFATTSDFFSDYFQGTEDFYEYSYIGIKIRPQKATVNDEKTEKESGK